MLSVSIFVLPVCLIVLTDGAYNASSFSSSFIKLKYKGSSTLLDLFLQKESEQIIFSYYQLQRRSVATHNASLFSFFLLFLKYYKSKLISCQELKLWGSIGRKKQVRTCYFPNLCSVTKIKGKVATFCSIFSVCFISMIVVIF